MFVIIQYICKNMFLVVFFCEFYRTYPLLRHGQVISPWHQQVQKHPDLLGYPADIWAVVKQWTTTSLLINHYFFFQRLTRTNIVYLLYLRACHPLQQVQRVQADPENINHSVSSREGSGETILSEVIHYSTISRKVTLKIIY